MNSEKRYALYYAPHEASALWRAGSAWIGRCAISGDAIKPPEVPGICAQQFAALTAAPRHYGFHATLKAPFRLAEGATQEILVAEVRAWGAGQSPFQMPRLEVRIVDDFLALAPCSPHQRLDSIAAECVKQFDHLRAPLTDAEVERRNPPRLSEHAVELMGLWGYPFVMDLFRFHLSLTGALPEDGSLRESLQSAASTEIGPPASAPAQFDSICLFEESAPGAEFRLVARAPFGA
jgi:putative phosphonate metabolism protein